MDEKKKDEAKSSELENLVVEALNDADLESVSGGHNVIISSAANSCCPQQN